MLFENYTCENSTELHCSIAEGIITIQCSLLCWHSSIFEQKSKRSCPSSAATHKWHSAVPYNWHDGANHDYKVDAATLSIQNLCWSLWCTHVSPSAVME